MYFDIFIRIYYRLPLEVDPGHAPIKIVYQNVVGYLFTKFRKVEPFFDVAYRNPQSASHPIPFGPTYNQITGSFSNSQTEAICRAALASMGLGANPALNANELGRLALMMFSQSLQNLSQVPQFDLSAFFQSGGGLLTALTGQAPSQTGLALPPPPPLSPLRQNAIQPPPQDLNQQENNSGENQK